MENSPATFDGHFLVHLTYISSLVGWRVCGRVSYAVLPTYGDVQNHCFVEPVEHQIRLQPLVSSVHFKGLLTYRAPVHEFTCLVRG